MSGEQELGVTESKNHNTGEWYAEVVQKAKLADYAPMGGFIVTRPRGYELWERLQNHLDGWFKETGAQNAYFPVLIPESFLEREADVVEGFDPEVAWVTHGGYDELEERLAVRPTSESIITPFMSEWTRSHRDLPMRLNQWCSVIRWEATETKPFFRTKEFLWQEGHTAHETEDGAMDEVMMRLGQYERLYEDVLAIPVLRGRKPEHDKFPGADVTTTVEALMPDGKSVQGGTSHALGQSFAEAYDVTFTDENEDEQTAWTTSWGLSWRALGALIMTHSDDQGLVLPPAVAPEQVVVVPIWQEDTKDEVIQYATDVAAELEDAGDVRVHLDDRDERNPGFKYNEWELKGVPLRIEIGPNEVEDEVVTAVRRSDNENTKRELDRSELVDAVDDQLDTVFDELYETAAENLVENVRTADEPEEIMGTIGQHGGYVKTAWCGDEACEEVIKEKVAAEITMLPLADGAVPEADVEGGEAVDVEVDECTMCGEPASEVAYFAKTY
jgi:prolyl-tRNA synthetase